MDHFDPLGGWECRHGLVGVHQYAEDDPIEERRRAQDHVQVAVRDRIEGARVDGNLHAVASSGDSAVPGR